MQNAGGGGEDQIRNVESVPGSSRDDGITGDNEAVRLDGSLGADRLLGGDGGDTPVGGAGNDFLFGGARSLSSSPPGTGRSPCSGVRVGSRLRFPDNSGAVPSDP